MKKNEKQNLNDKLIKLSYWGILAHIKKTVADGADLQTEDGKVLINAAHSNSLEVVKFIMENGNYSKKQKERAFVQSVVNQDLNVIKYLAEQGVNIDSEKNNALITASINDCFEAVEYLIESGANIHIGEDAALIDGAQYESWDVVKLLLKNGADVSAQKNRLYQYITIDGDLELIKSFIFDYGLNIELMLDGAMHYERKEIIEWCQNYIESKDLKNKIETELPIKKDKDRSNKNKI